MEDILHDGDLFLNTTVDEIVGVLDKTVNVVNDEITNVETEFDGFVDGMLEDVQFDVMTDDLNLMLGLFDTYENIQTHVTQAKLATGYKGMGKPGGGVHTWTNCRDVPLCFSALSHPMSQLNSESLSTNNRV